MPRITDIILVSSVYTHHSHAHAFLHFMHVTCIHAVVCAHVTCSHSHAHRATYMYLWSLDFYQVDAYLYTHTHISHTHAHPPHTQLFSCTTQQS